MDMLEVKLDKIIELLETLVQRWSPMELHKTNVGPIVRDLHKVPDPMKPKIVFEDTASPFNGSTTKSEYTPAPGWGICIENNDFEINKEDMTIRHILSKKVCKVVYDQDLYAVPKFDDHEFAGNKRYIEIIAQQFIPKHDDQWYAVPKDGNRFNYSLNNVKWSKKELKDEKPLSDEMVLDQTFIGPLNMLNEENFLEHNLIQWKHEVWQETHDQMYVKAPKEKDGWLVLTDEGKLITVSI
jgi:hypothetical protein